MSAKESFAEACATARAGVVATPEVTITDPKGHRIAPVRLYLSETGAPQLWASRHMKDGVFVNRWADGDEGIQYPSVRIRCPACTYRGERKQEQLLALYAHALADGSLEIHVSA